MRSSVSVHHNDLPVKVRASIQRKSLGIREPSSPTMLNIQRG